MLITKKKERSHSIGGASTGEVIIQGSALRDFERNWREEEERREK